MMQLKSGTLLQGGKYRIEKILGQGTFGVTYLASTIINGPLGDIAVKVVIKEFFMKELNTRMPDGSVLELSSGSLSENYSNMFLREARNLSHLNHKGIVNILEIFSENNTHYYVMEYLDGESLDEYILRNGPMSESVAVAYVNQIADALSFMHSHLMLHLDLKPKNIMLRSDGTTCIVDFGLSKQYNQNGEPETSTSIGLGTPGYAPLEQGNAADRKSFSPTLDIYAFGATLYKMLTGDTPPRASSVLNEGFPEDKLRCHGVSEILISAIRCAMSSRKSERPQSVDSFVSMLSGNATSFSVPCSTNTSRIKWPATGALPVGYIVLGPKYYYEILRYLSHDSCSIAYLASAVPRDGKDKGLKDTAFEVVLFEMYPNRYMGGRVGKAGMSYEIDSSVSDYGTMRNEYEEKMAVLSSNRMAVKIEDYFVHENGDPHFPFMSFLHPIPDAVFDDADLGGTEEPEWDFLDPPVEPESTLPEWRGGNLRQPVEPVPKNQRTSDMQDESIFKIILSIINLCASFFFPYFGWILCVLLTVFILFLYVRVGMMYWAGLLLLVSSISIYYVMKLRHESKNYQMLLIVYVLFALFALFSLLVSFDIINL